MELIAAKEENNWVLSRWDLTYKVGWEHIQKGVSAVYDFYSNPEILVASSPIKINSKEDIMNIPETMNLTIRGMSDIIKAPIMITFYNQMQAVDVSVAQVSDEFKNINYEKFNHSLCQYLDSIEIAMYRK